MLQIKSFAFNPLQENTYVLHDNSKECVVIDPGNADAEENEALDSYITSHSLNVKMLLNTHCHIDHVLGNYFVKTRYKVKLYIHRLDQPLLKAAEVYAPHYGFFNYQAVEADEFLEEGGFVTFGEQTLKVLFVPGHAPGHVAFYSEKEKIVIGGDVLFYNSIGRTDLPGGNHQTLLHSIREKFFVLPDDVQVYPGHGPITSIGFEKKTNPFVYERS